MGQDLTYQADDAIYEYRISRADWHLIQALREHLPEEVEALFIVPAMGEPLHVATTVLRSAADTVLAFVTRSRDVLPYTYQFKLEFPSDPRMTPGFSTGGMSGMRLPGDSEHYYAIRAGLNECRLEKWGIGPDGRGCKIDERDLRGEREFLSANMGNITIRRTRAKADLVKALSEIQRFLQRVSSLEVVKSVG